MGGVRKGVGGHVEIGRGMNQGRKRGVEGPWTGAERVDGRAAPSTETDHLLTFADSFELDIGLSAVLGCEGPD